MRKEKGPSLKFSSPTQEVPERGVDSTDGRDLRGCGGTGQGLRRTTSVNSGVFKSMPFNPHISF